MSPVICHYYYKFIIVYVCVSNLKYLISVSLNRFILFSISCFYILLLYFSYLYNISTVKDNHYSFQNKYLCVCLYLFLLLLSQLFRQFSNYLCLFATHMHSYIRTCMVVNHKSISTCMCGIVFIGVSLNALRNFPIQ